MAITRNFRLVLALSLLLIGSGCAQFSAPVKKSSAATQARARQFSPPEGKIGIYILRGYQFAAAGAPVPVFLDHSKFGTLPPNSYLYCEALAREHVLELAELPMAKSTSLRFRSDPGQCYFFDTKVVLGGFKIEPLKEDEARKRVSKLKLSGDSVFEQQMIQRPTGKP